MQSLVNPILLFVQIGKPSSPYSKQTSNVCLLLLPCPSLLFECLCECVFVIKPLPCCRDIDLNPGPTNKGILDAITKLSEIVDHRHVEVMKVLDYLKTKQEALVQTVAYLSKQQD